MCILGGGGTQIACGASSVIEFCSGVSISAECHIVSRKKITIGKNSTISWNTLLMDTDSHNIFVNQSIVNKDKSVEIGNNVWVSSGVSLLKGTKIPNGCIVAAGSVISGKTEGIKKNSIICGMPVRVIRENIEWKI